MLHVNRATLVGNAGKDAELSKTSQGDDMARFSLATSERWTDGEGRQQERTQWHNVVAFRHHAVAAGRFVRKGSRVLVEGKIEQRDWTDGEGKPRRIVEIRVAGSHGMVNVLDGGPADAQENAAPEAAAADAGAGEAAAAEA